MADFQKTKVKTNLQEVENKLTIYKGRTQYYQKVIDMVKNVKPDFQFGTNDLSVMFSNPKKYFVNKLITGPTTIAGIQLSKEKVFELLSESESLNEIVQYIQKLKGNSPNTIDYSERDLGSYTANYRIGENDLVVFLESDVKADLENRYSIFVKTQRQKDAHDSLQIIWDELKKLQGVYQRSQMKFIEENFIWSYDGNIQDVEYNYLHSLE